MKISKSLSLKVNLGNYQVADFFCSAEEEMDLLPKGISPKEHAEEIARVADNLHAFCKNQITKDVNNSKKYLQDLANGKVEESAIDAHKKICKFGEKGCACGVYKHKDFLTEFADHPSDSSADLVGEYPGSMNPPRKDKKVN